jgi:hypothetical protein
MSDYVRREELQILLAKNDPIESPQHKNYMWMSRWTKASSSAEPQNYSTCNHLEDLNKGTGTGDSGIPPPDFIKSTVAERLVVGVNRGSASMQHYNQFSSDMRGVVQDARGDKSFVRCMKQNGRALVSETYSVRKLSELPSILDLGSSDNPSSDWSHFPMFEINRKFDNILNPKRRSALGPASLNVNISASRVMELQDYMVQSHRMSDENKDIWKPTGGIVSHLEGTAGISSDPSGQKLKGDLSDTMSYSCKKDDNSSDCQIDEQHTSNCIADSKHELPYVSSGKKLYFQGNNRDQIAISAFNKQKSIKPAVYKQQDVAGDIFRAPVLGTECHKEPTNCFYKSKQGDENFHGTFECDGTTISSLPYEQQHLKTQRTESAANLNLSDPVVNTLTVTSESLRHGKEPKQKCTGSLKRKGPCLYEMLTTAPQSQSACLKNSVSSGNAFDVCTYGTNIGSRLFGTLNQSSARTETLYSDTLCVSKENEFHDVNEHHDVSSKATIASKQSCMPATGTTNRDLMLFQMSRMRNPISIGVVQPPVSDEPSVRWLKRLHLDVLDHEIPSSKRPKVGGSPPGEDSSCLFSMAHHCNRTDNEELIDIVKDDKVSDEGIKLHDNPKSHVPAKSMNYWIGRLCEGGTPVFHGDQGQQRQATKPDQASEELRGQFPSIAAMAMMGRAMNKIRPWKYQKKGPFVVWKTE